MADETVYVVLEQPALASWSGPRTRPTELRYRYLKHKPRNVCDLRFAAQTLDSIYAGITRWQLRRAKAPDTVRLNRDTLHALGQPTELFGVRVTK